MPPLPMPKEELLVSLREKHGDDIGTMSDLQAPSSEFMMRYFATVLSELGIDIKGMTNYVLLESTACSDSYKDILPYTQVYFAVKKVYPIRNYLKNFSVLSLMEPKPDDIYYVAVMDNFLDYYFQKMSEQLNPRLEELGTMSEQLKQLEQQKVELQHRLNDQAAARSKRAMEQDKVEEEMKEIELEMQEMRQQEQLLQLQLEEQEKVSKELRQEVKTHRLQLEQLEEQRETKSQFEELSRELQQLRVRNAEQEETLTEKRSALQDKASRNRFLEECIMLEGQAFEATAMLVAAATETEKRKKSWQDSERNKELMIQKTEVEMKSLNNLKSRNAALVEEIAEVEKRVGALKKEKSESERRALEIQSKVEKTNQKLVSTQAKAKGVEDKISEAKEKLSLLDQSFETEYDKMCKKAEFVEQEIVASLKKKLDELDQ